MLNISFMSSNSLPQNTERTIISVDFSNGVKLIDKMNESYTEGEIDRITDRW